MLTNLTKFPAPIFGGKRLAAPVVWAALGDVAHYVEPFCRSAAVLLERPHPCNRPYYSETLNDIDAFVCLGADTRLLTADLRWISAGDVEVDDMLLGFDENNTWTQAKTFGAPTHYRHWRTTRVVAVHEVVKPSYRLVFSDGTTLIASEDHQWLGGTHRTNGTPWRWITTKGMVCNRAEQCSWVLKLSDVIQQEQTYDAGWLGGFTDGEGHLVGTQYGWHATIHQRLGPELEKAQRILEKYGFTTRADIRTPPPGPLIRVGGPVPKDSEKHYAPVGAINILGGMRETLRFLMLFRPERLLRKAIERASVHSLYGRERQAVALVEKTPVGLHKVMAIETDSHTFVAEGLASHNCNALRAIAFAPQATAEAASWPVSECDLHARHLRLLAWAQDAAIERLSADPAWCDPVMAGWWLYGLSAWIGAGWCDGSGPWVLDPVAGRIVRRSQEPGVRRKLPHLSNNGKGVHRMGTREPGVRRKLPHLSNNGTGVHRMGTREPGVQRQDGPCDATTDWEHHVEADYAATEGFHPMTMPELRRWFAFLRARLRHVRLVHGDWSRVVTSGALKTLVVRQKQGVAGIFCLHQDTLIRLEDEQVYPIWQIQKGDRLHGGKIVHHVSCRQHQGNLLHIKVQGTPDLLRVTAEHRIMRIPKRSGKRNTRQDHRTDAQLWNARETLEAHKLEVGDYLLIPQGGIEQPMEWKWWETPRAPHVTNQTPVTFTPQPSLWRLLGYYAAEGYIQYDKKHRPKAVDFVFGMHEMETYIKDVSELSQRNFGIIPTLRPHPSRGSCVVHIGSVPVARFFAHYVRGDAVTKTLHPAVMIASTENQLAFLQGWLRGDGGIEYGGRNKCKLTGTTASHAMARQLYTMGLRCSLKPSWKYRQHNVDIYFASADAQRLGWEVPARTFRSTRRSIQGYLLSRIVAVTSAPYHGLVYDLTIDQDHHFAAPYILVHNCDPPYSLTERDPGLYAHDATPGDALAAAVRAWCLAHGADPAYRIVLAGFAGEGHEVLEAHGWTVRSWFTEGLFTGGMGKVSATGQHQQHRERLWCSPHCLGAAAEDRQLGLWAEMAPREGPRL